MQDHSLAAMQAATPKVFLKFALPSIVTMLFFGLQNLIAALIIGNFLGAKALGGVNIILPLFSLEMVLALIVGIGIQTLVSQNLGRQKPKRVQQAVKTGFIGLSLASLLASSLLWLLREPLIRAMGADEILFPYALAYFTGLVPFMLPMALSFYTDLLLKAFGRPLLSSLIMSSVVLINILLSLLFVLWLDLGVFGASLATSIAFSLAFFVAIFFLPKPYALHKGRFSYRLLGKACYNGSSEGVAELSSAIAVLIINRSVMAMLGAEGVSAYAAISYIQFMGVLIFLGISDGLIPVMAYYYGAGKKERLQNLFRFAAKTNAALGLIIFAALQLWGAHIVRLFFHSGDTAVIRLASESLRIFSWVFLLEGITILITSYFTALGNALSSIIIAALRGVIFIAIGMAILPRLFGTDGIWLTLIASECLGLLAAIWLLKQLHRRFDSKTIAAV